MELNVNSTKHASYDALEQAVEGMTFDSRKSMYAFFRSDGWYPLELWNDSEARRNAESNPGTIRVVNMVTTDQVYPLQ